VSSRLAAAPSSHAPVEDLRPGYSFPGTGSPGNQRVAYFLPWRLIPAHLQPEYYQFMPPTHALLFSGKRRVLKTSHSYPSTRTHSAPPLGVSSPLVGQLLMPHPMLPATHLENISLGTYRLMPSAILFLLGYPQSTNFPGRFWIP
jgi:hypothetical protein